MREHDGAALLREFGTWAARRGLRVHRHDAQFVGRIDDVPVEIETGIRGSNLYVVVAMLAIASGLPPAPLRSPLPSEEDVHREGAHDARALRQVIRSRPIVQSLRIESARITVRMTRGSPPDAVEAVLDDVLAAARIHVEFGPYR